MAAAAVCCVLPTIPRAEAALFGPKKLRIVTTTTDLRSIAEAVGGDKVTVTNLATGYQDPHFLETKPSYMMKARRADVWIRVGMELEIGYEEPIIDGSRNRRIRIGTLGHLDVSKDVMRLEVPTTQKVDRSMGDVHPLGNPHYWLDPLNGKVVATNIADRLAQLRPADAAYFRANAAAFHKRIDESLFGKGLVAKLGGENLCAILQRGQLAEALKGRNLETDLAGWVGQLWPYRGAKVVTYHRSWSYFAHRFGLEVIDELEPKPGVPPSPRHVREVIESMNAQNVRVILVEPFYERRTPNLVAGKTRARVVPIPNAVGGTPEASDYLALFDCIVARLVEALASGEK